MMRLLPRSLLATVLVISPGAQAAGEVIVYKNPHCGCCGKWVEHLQRNGFQTIVRDVVDLTEIKARYGMPPHLASCHTAVVDGYVLEGHVPAEAAERLLREKLPVKGLAVPGMPVGSPGMEGPDPRPYKVYTFDDKGEAQVYMRYSWVQQTLFRRLEGRHSYQGQAAEKTSLPP